MVFWQRSRSIWARAAVLGAYAIRWFVRDSILNWLCLELERMKMITCGRHSGALVPGIAFYETYLGEYSNAQSVGQYGWSKGTELTCWKLYRYMYIRYLTYPKC